MKKKLIKHWNKRMFIEPHIVLIIGLQTNNNIENQHELIQLPIVLILGFNQN